MRKAIKIRFTPTSADHPYKYKDIYIDTNSMEPMYSFAYDRKGELWKIIWHNKVWSDNPDSRGLQALSGRRCPPRDLTVVADVIVNVQTGTGNRIEFWDRTGHVRRQHRQDPPRDRRRPPHQGALIARD